VETRFEPSLLVLLDNEADIWRPKVGAEFVILIHGQFNQDGIYLFVDSCRDASISSSMLIGMLAIKPWLRWL